MTPHGGYWVRDPDSGGKKIPALVQADLIKRINQLAQVQYKSRYIRLDIRFRAQFCYIDAYTEPNLAEDWTPPGWDETREEALERLRNSPIHLCRLRYFGNDEWALLFIPIATKNMSLVFIPTANLPANPKMLFLLLPSI